MDFKTIKTIKKFADMTNDSYERLINEFGGYKIIMDPEYYFVNKINNPIEFISSINKNNSHKRIKFNIGHMLALKYFYLLKRNVLLEMPIYTDRSLFLNALALYILLTTDKNVLFIGKNYVLDMYNDLDSSLQIKDESDIRKRLFTDTTKITEDDNTIELFNGKSSILPHLGVHTLIYTSLNNADNYKEWIKENRGKTRYSYIKLTPSELGLDKKWFNSVTKKYGVYKKVSEKLFEELY